MALIEREAPQESHVLASGGESSKGQCSKGPTEWCVVRRAKEPARGTLDLPGGFSDMFETSEEGVCREVLEETGLHVDRVEFLFSLPNQYEYSGFLVHTIDMFYRCHVADTSGARAADDAGELMWLRPEDIRAEDFGLRSVRKGVEKLLAMYRERQKQDFRA